jgi:hypothetical protein
MDEVWQIAAEEIVITREPQEPLEELDKETARQIADFYARFSSLEEPDNITVDYGVALEFTIDLDEIQAILKDAGFDPIDLPQDLDGTKVSVDVPASVAATYGSCQNIFTDPDDSRVSYYGSPDCQVHLQMPSPTVTTSKEVNPQELAQIGLNYLGYNEEEASELSRSLDWASTLVIPVPTEEMESSEVTVDDTTATLLQERNSDEEHPPYTLIWIHDGILNAVIGFGNAEDGIAIATNLQ